MVKLILLLAAIALGADALMNNGAYTQAAWSKLQNLRIESTSDPKPADRPT